MIDLLFRDLKGLYIVSHSQQSQLLIHIINDRVFLFLPNILVHASHNHVVYLSHVGFDILRQDFISFDLLFDSLHEGGIGFVHLFEAFLVMLGDFVQDRNFPEVIDEFFCLSDSEMKDSEVRHFYHAVVFRRGWSRRRFRVLVSIVRGGPFEDFTHWSIKQIFSIYLSHFDHLILLIFLNALWTVFILYKLELSRFRAINQAHIEQKLSFIILSLFRQNHIFNKLGSSVIWLDNINFLLFLLQNHDLVLHLLVMCEKSNHYFFLRHKVYLALCSPIAQKILEKLFDRIFSKNQGWINIWNQLCENLIIDSVWIAESAAFYLLPLFHKF